MKVQLFVMGVDQGEIEVDDNSIVGSFLRGDWQQGLARTQQLAKQMQQLAPPRRCLRCGEPVVGDGALCAACAQEREL